MTELEPAGGQGSEFFTDRSIFYLQHRLRINEWWNLRPEAANATSRFLETLAEPIADIGNGWLPWDGSIDRYRCLFLAPPGVDTSEFPWTGVALGWAPQGVMPEVKNQSPWVGLHVYPEHEAADKLRAALDSIDPNPSGYDSSKPWPRYRWIPGGDRWWRDLDGYRVKLLDELGSLLNRYRGSVESVVR